MVEPHLVVDEETGVALLVNKLLGDETFQHPLLRSFVHVPTLHLAAHLLATVLSTGANS